MNNGWFGRIFWGSLIILPLVACSNKVVFPVADGSLPNNLTETSVEVAEIIEYDIIEIPLEGELASASMEYSGLAWHQQSLVLLPQYPNRGIGDEGGLLYAIDQQQLTSYLNGFSAELAINEIPFDDADLSKQLDGFEGFEAIVFIEDSVYLTIETRGGNPMKSFIVKGAVEENRGNIVSIKLDGSSLVELPVQNNNSNASYEALTSDSEFIYAFFEQNGKGQNDQPYAIRLDATLSETQEINLDSINYRLTDATMIDEEGCFWMINYFFPGDTHLAVVEDPISARFGLGESHLRNEPVERLVKFCLGAEGFVLTEDAPQYLTLLENDEARNWEGLVEFGDLGFLLITDKFPTSILALVKIQ